MIQLILASPFWEDPANLAADGEDEEAVIAICVRALQAEGYDIRVRDDDGEETPYEAPDAEAS